MVGALRGKDAEVSGTTIGREDVVAVLIVVNGGRRLLVSQRQPRSTLIPYTALVRAKLYDDRPACGLQHPAQILPVRSIVTQVVGIRLLIHVYRRQLHAVDEDRVRSVRCAIGFRSLRRGHAIHAWNDLEGPTCHAQRPPTE